VGGNSSYFFEIKFKFFLEVKLKSFNKEKYIFIITFFFFLKGSYNNLIKVHIYYRYRKNAQFEFIFLNQNYKSFNHSIINE